MRKVEMGNTNTSGIIQEEAGGAALSPNDPASGNDNNVEKLTSISRDEAEDSSIKSSDDIQTVDSIEEEEPKYEESNHSIESSPDTGEVANINGPFQPLDCGCNPASRNGENFAEVDDDDDDTNEDKENSELMVKETAYETDRVMEDENGLVNEDEEGNVDLNLGKTDLSSNVEEEDVTKMNITLEQDIMIGNAAQNQEKEEGYYENSISCLETESIVVSNMSQPDIKDCLVNETKDEEKTFKKDTAKELKFEAAGNGDVHKRAELPENDTIEQIFVTNEVQTPEKQQSQAVDPTEHDMPPHLSDDQCANGIIRFEATRRYSVDYSSEPPAGCQIQTRRFFPSFDFGIPSSESDQTPLLRPDKPPPPTRRLSIDFQNTVLPPTYARDSLDYDTMGVEEKAVDAPFLITVKKEENGNSLTEKTAEILLADIKNIPPANDQLVLASPKGGNGKRKPLPSFFSTCICCTATSN